MSKEAQKLRRNKYEVFSLYFTSYASNLIEGDQAQYGVLKKRQRVYMIVLSFQLCYDTLDYLNKRYSIIL